MTTLFTLTFQGELTAAGPVSPEEARDAARSAFPMSPPRDAAVKPGFRAFKMAPLDSGRVLLSTVENRGDRDGYDRPVLRATGCLVEAAEMSGALRDPTAVWEALADGEIEGGGAALERRAAALSIHAAPEAFALFRAELERSGGFYARIVAVLSEPTVDLYLEDPAWALERLRPVFGLLPLARLTGLDLAIGGERSEPRERVLGLAEVAPEDLGEGRGLLSRLVGRNREPKPAAVDFRVGEVYGGRSGGPQALAATIADPRPWPGGLAGLERYRVLLRCLDAREAEDRSLTPFDLVPELAEARRAVHRVEALSKELGRGR